MLYRSLFPRDLFADVDRLQRELQGYLEPDAAGIRGQARQGYPALNIGTTAQSVEVLAFAPGLDPATLDVQVERGVLTLAGERKPSLPGQPGGDDKSSVHQAERFAGRFRRVVNLPDDVDAQAVSAQYRDGVLHVSLPRRAAPQPRRIAVQ